MAMVECGLCGGRVNTTAKNYVYANELHQHRKCPSKAPKLSDQEVKDRKELTDSIKWLAVKYGKPLNWGLITAQIKRLLEQGYSHSDQLYALKWLVEKDGEFWGYGRLEKFIVHAMEHRKRLAEFEEKKLAEKIKVEQKPEIKVNSNPTFFDVGGDDISWL